MLAPRDGVGPSQVALPAGPWPRMIDFLATRFPAIPLGEWHLRMARGDVVDGSGLPVAPDRCYAPHGKLFYFRSVPDEAANPSQAEILFQDELLVVADKPHFLPVTPSGPYLQHTLLVRLRREVGLDGLTPLHRIDRETAGVVLFAKQPATCAAYHGMFAAGEVIKSYEAIAPFDATLQFPLTRATHLVDGEHFMQMRESGAPTAAGRVPNSRTEIELVETRGALARYRLRPLTGKRHQLRVHMAALGLPIVGDRIYPVLQPHGGDEPENPLRLLARSITFIDPVTQERRSFASRRELRFPAQEQRDRQRADPAAGARAPMGLPGADDVHGRGGHGGHHGAQAATGSAP